MWQQISVLVRHSLPLLFTPWCFHTVPLLSALSLSSILYIWLMKKKNKTENQWCFCFTPTEVWNGNQSAGSRQEVCKNNSRETQTASQSNTGRWWKWGGQWKDKRGVWGGGWRGLERCDRVERDWGWSSCSPAGQRCSAIGFISEWRILWMLSGMGSVARNYMHIRISAQESNI